MPIKGTQIELGVTYAMSYAKGHNQANFSAEKTAVLTVAAPNIATVPQHRHRIDEIQISSSTPDASHLDTALIEPDGVILVSVTATTIPTITGSASLNRPIFHTLDVHYQSTNVGTKQKTPDFYT